MAGLISSSRTGTFTEVSAEFGAILTEHRASRGVVFGDLDNDGDIDLLVADLDGTPQLLRNENGNANNSILIKTVGVKSNRGGVGARVKVVSGDLTQTDEVRSGDSYISQSDMRLHFGLEKRTKIDSIEVRWPSGTVDKITGVGVNRVITIKEGQGKVDEKEFSKASS
ncbi:MAG TPA: CRTAC1 family protein [Pyrinomonadaceae bacterium]|nr:CRTAC1 family protein [Pyrinomonadaceae bacterium]